MISYVKVKFRDIAFQKRAKNDNSEFSLPSMIPRVTKNSELSFLCMGPKTISTKGVIIFQLKGGGGGGVAETG